MNDATYQDTKPKVPRIEVKDTAGIRYVLGVDGGGTKTHCALFSLDGILVDFLQWRTTSHEFLPGGYEELRTELKSLLDLIAARNRLDWRQVQVVFGLAGVDCKRQEAIVATFVEAAGLQHYLVRNDGYLGIKSATPQGWGMCVFNGSGTGACGIHANGKACARGALFELSGDYAGGRILGAEVIRAAYDMLFRFGNVTQITTLLMKKLHTATPEEMMDRLICGCSDHTLETKHFVPILFEAANNQDEIALQILQKSGEMLAKDIVSVIRTLGFEEDTEIPVVLLGSLFTKCVCQGHIISMQDAVRAQLPQYKIKYQMLAGAPVAGAVCWAMELIGKWTDREQIMAQIKAACAGDKLCMGNR